MTYIYTYRYTHIFVYIHTHIYICIGIFIRTYVNFRNTPSKKVDTANIYTGIYAFMHLYIFMFMYIDINIHVHTLGVFTYIHAHTCIHQEHTITASGRRDTGDLGAKYTHTHIHIYLFVHRYV